MKSPNNQLDIAKTSLKFMGISIGIIIISLLIAWGILQIAGKFTYWAILPILIGFPITLRVNLQLAKKTIAQSRGQRDEETE